MLDEPGQVPVEGSDLARYQRLGPRQKHTLWLFLSSFSLSDLLCKPRPVFVAKDWMLPERQLREPRHEQCRILKQHHAQLKQQLHELVEVSISQAYICAASSSHGQM
jgi:hypothetical protein